MASRLRGMTILSSTIIPRTQRLLETGVLKERPVWLDVVEAYPPLPAPPIPLSHQKGRFPEIVYPEDNQPAKVIAAPRKMSRGRIVSWNVVSSFEAPALVKVKRWNPEGFENVSEVEKCSELATEGKSVPTTSTAAEQITVADSSDYNRATSTQSSAEVEVMPNFEDALDNLTNMLKGFEKNK